MRLNESRTHDFRQGKRLGPYDRLVTWHKPQRQRKTATRRLWNALPAQITLRLIRYPVCIPGFRSRYIILVTTLLDPVAYPAAELAQLYARRWSVKLFFRHIKTTLQMDGSPRVAWVEPEDSSFIIVEVGTPVARRPPHRSRRAVFPHQMWCSTFGALCGQLGYVVLRFEDPAFIGVFEVPTAHNILVTIQVSGSSGRG